MSECVNNVISLRWTVKMTFCSNVQIYTHVHTHKTAPDCGGLNDVSLFSCGKMYFETKLRPHSWWHQQKPVTAEKNTHLEPKISMPVQLKHYSSGNSGRAVHHIPVHHSVQLAACRACEQNELYAWQT